MKMLRLVKPPRMANVFLRFLEHPTSLCFLAGAASAFALPPLSWVGLFFLGFGFFVHAFKKARDVFHAFSLSWFYALGYHTFGLYWISASLFTDIEKYFWVLPFALFLLPAYLALLFAAAGAIAHPLRDKDASFSIFLACSFFFSEVLRSGLMTGFPWNLFGYVWTGILPMLQSTSLFGIYGLTFLTLLAAISLSGFLEKPRTSAVALFACVWSLLAALHFWGETRLENDTGFHDDITVRLVQGAVGQAERRTHEQREDAFLRYIALSRTQTPRPPTHIIWPETATPYFLTRDEAARRALQPLIPKGGALITGAPSREERDGKTIYYNSLFALDDTGQISGLYDKVRLVPFGEFIPLREIWNALPIAADVIGGKSDFSRGTGPKVLHAPGFPSFSPMICYEAVFSGSVTPKQERPELLLQVTNDAWFGNTSGPYQHLAMAQVRAIEEGLPLLRSANTGISAAVDPYGRIVSQLGLGERNVMDAAVPLPLPATLFSQHRHTPVFISALILFFAAGRFFFRLTPLKK